MKTAVVLINLGTPEAPTKQAVRTYLKEFLWDPLVVQIPRIIWWPILNLIVLRTRPEKSAAAYQRVWTEQGSPLKVLSVKVQQKLQALVEQKLPNKIKVVLAMRYGQPSIKQVTAELEKEGYQRVIALALYPQQAASSAGTAWHAFDEAMQQWKKPVPTRVVGAYYNNPAYISALAKSVGEYWAENGRAEKLLVSFHGVPQKTIDQGDPYLKHCTETAKLLALELGLADTEWQQVFQSRFGKGGWVKPYCIDVLEQLPKAGVKSLDIICPGFAVDCLETLDEMEVENREVFVAAGGESYRYIGALNDRDEHIEMLLSLVESEVKLDS